MEDRFKPPFIVGHNGDSYWVQDADGKRFSFTYYRDRPIVGTDNSVRVSRRLAERAAKWTARTMNAAAR